MKEVIITLIVVLITLALVYTGFVSNNDEKDDKSQIFKPESIANEYRMGPIILKISDEWFLKDEDRKYIRIGQLKTAWGPTAGSEYPDLSPSALSFNTSETTIVNEKPVVNKELEINTYEIECKDNTLWIDINILIANIISHDGKKLKILLSDVKDFYIYHPTLKKWFGPEKYDDTSFEFVMYSELYNEKNTTDDASRLINKFYGGKQTTLESIINTRTLIVPSLKYYNDVIYGFTDDKGPRTAIYNWYTEKEVKEKVAPKSEDE